jgi:uncharacterized glyoxalase superfamily protein PhnB
MAIAAQNITPCLWFDTEAEDAAKFYCSVFKDSRITKYPAEAERLFNALAKGGSVRMALEETFWAHKFGMLTDRFGTPWMINCEKPQ